MTYNKYKFHCSSLPTLMTNSRAKGLSETVKAELEKIWIEEELGRKKDITSKYTEKGLLCEQDSINLLNKVKGEQYVKNEKVYENEYITGTPDITSRLTDIKTSWDIWSFVKQNEKRAIKAYFYQLLGYMILTGQKQANLVYCLVNTPASFIRDEIYKMSFHLPAESLEYKKQEAQIRKNMTYDDIPAGKRVKIFKFSWSQDEEDKLKIRVSLWREYLNSLSL